MTTDVNWNEITERQEGLVETLQEKLKNALAGAAPAQDLRNIATTLAISVDKLSLLSVPPRGVEGIDQLFRRFEAALKDAEAGGK